ncbi:Mitochondrial inner membrane peptidase complex subunit [Trebouxia sp. C0009 RCD-2024]
MYTNEYAKFQQVAVTAAQAAGQLIEQAFTKDKNIEFKGKLDLVTATDKDCELIIFNSIREAFPEHKFIGEEGSAAQGFTSHLTDAPTWMVDPLDGTTNFVHRFPFVCTSIALVIGKEIVVGVVYNPIMKELFTAIKGQGAFLNGQPIRVSTKTQLDQALLATEVGVSRDTEVMDAIFDRIRSVTSRMRSIRCSGACALNLCSVACGRIDAMYEVGFGGCWDCAAGALMVTEAGGEMLDPSGGPFDIMARRVLGANAHLGKPVAAIIAGCKSSNKEPQPLRQ